MNKTCTSQSDPEKENKHAASCVDFCKETISFMLYSINKNICTNQLITVSTFLEQNCQTFAGCIYLSVEFSLFTN